jgi:hypothetical protein
MSYSTTKERLLSKISSFLEVREVNETSSHTPVEDSEIKELYDIFYDIVMQKYDQDCDGDLPVQVRIIDKTKYSSNNFFPVPHLSTEASLPEIQEYLRYASTNVSMAQEQIRIGVISLEWAIETSESKK